MAKTTLRVPDRVIEALRQRSQEEGRSVNDVAIQALERGLGIEEEPDAWWKSLYPLKFTPPTRKFDAEEWDRYLKERDKRLGWSRDERLAEARGLQQALQWVKRDSWETDEDNLDSCDG